MKKCGRCLLYLELTEFHNNKKSKDGLCGQCKKCAIDRSKIYHQKNRSDILSKQKEYRKNNREYFNAKNKEWNNKTGYLKRYQQERIKSDPFFKFKNRLRTLIRVSITRQGYTKKSNVFNIIGCDYSTLIMHIESMFDDRMTWDNHGEWHIDHIIPMSEAKTEEDVIRLNHYTNLQPLWAIDNLKKYNKVNNETFKNTNDEPTI